MDVKIPETNLSVVPTRFMSISQAGGFLPTQDELSVNEASAVPERKGTIDSVMF